MPRNEASSKLHKPITFIVGGLLLFLAWRVLSLGLADHFAVDDPARALFWRPDHPEALVRRAEELAADGQNAEEAEKLARRALEVNPLDGRAFRVLGLLEETAGDQQSAIELYRMAVRRTPRDLQAQSRLADHLLRSAEFPEGLRAIDMMLRVEPGLYPQIEPTLIAVAQHPPAQQAYAELLESRPPWRSRAIISAVRKAPQGGAIEPLMEQLRGQPGGLAPPEQSAWIDRLVADGQVGKAYLTWVAMLPEERRLRLGNVYNGGFEMPPVESGFGWRFGRIRGARIERASGTGVTDRFGLRIVFEDRRVPFAHVRQLLALPPGRYQLAGRAKAENLRSEQGLVWSVRCRSGGPYLAHSEPVRGNRPWREFSNEFEVPAEGCEGQWLTLRHAARFEAEQRIGGRAWYDDIRITRVQ